MKALGVLAGLLAAALLALPAPGATGRRSAGLIALSRCRPDGCGEGTDLWVMRQDATGLRRLTRRATHNDAPCWSPDGTRLVFVSGDSTSSHIWLIGSDGSRLTQLTSGPALDEQPAWSPTGDRIVYVRALSDTEQWLVVLDLGRGTEKTVVRRPGTYRHPTWSPDGRTIAFSYARQPKSGRYAIFEVGADGQGLHRISRDPHDDYWDPAWSPDGRSLAFTLVYRRGKGYRADLEVMRADGRGERALARAPAGSAFFSPSWSPDSGALVFVELHSSDGMGRISFVDVNGRGLHQLAGLLSDNRAPAWQPAARR